MLYVNHISINLEEKVHETKKMCNSKHHVNINTQLSTVCPLLHVLSDFTLYHSTPHSLFSGTQGSLNTAGSYLPQDLCTCCSLCQEYTFSRNLHGPLPPSPVPGSAPMSPYLSFPMQSPVISQYSPSSVPGMGQKNRLGRGAGVVTKVGQWVSGYREISRAWQDSLDNIKFFVIKFWKGSFF